MAEQQGLGGVRGENMIKICYMEFEKTDRQTIIFFLKKKGGPKGVNSVPLYWYKILERKTNLHDIKQIGES